MKNLGDMGWDGQMYVCTDGWTDTWTQQQLYAPPKIFSGRMKKSHKTAMCTRILK